MSAFLQARRHNGGMFVVGWAIGYLVPAVLSGWAAHYVAGRRLALRPLWTVVGLSGRLPWDFQKAAPAG
jgi:hypothetical protein